MYDRDRPRVGVSSSHDTTAGPPLTLTCNVHPQLIGDPQLSKFIVVTTINEPSPAVKRFAALPDWQLIVVGDKKTPRSWDLPGATYLSPRDQTDLPYEIASRLPWNHYSRKMLGYLYAISQGATVIADTDDDNIPAPGWGVVDFTSEISQVHQPRDFINVYAHFTDRHVWPRGLPLRRILASEPWSLTEPEVTEVGVWQHLADGDPDVDAIYRLVTNEPVTFDAAPAIALGPGVWCPFNSQNTFIREELFPLLYLPAFVTFRFTDILRGVVAQPLMWERGYSLAFGGATVVQERNPHDHFEDFRSELPMYCHIEATAAIAAEAAGPDLPTALASTYDRLQREDIVSLDELSLLRSWLNDVATAGWSRS